VKIYVASSWRNPHQPPVVALLREHGHEVYDFRNPGPDRHGFGWKELDPDWESWTADQYRRALTHPVAAAGFFSDFEGMRWADACVLVHPCGRSAHLELGWSVGAGKLTAVYFPDEVAGAGKVEPELMARLASAILVGSSELLEWLASWEPAAGPESTGRRRRS
jgi:hypothetical protein